MAEPVDERRVLRAWLAREAERAAVDVDPSTASRADLVDALLSAKPGAATFLCRERPIRWYRVDLDWATFATLSPVRGPDDRLWRAASTDGTLVGVAEHAREHGIRALSDHGVDAGAVRRYRDALAAGDGLDPLVVRTRRGATPWYVADGNHRATAVALRRLDAAGEGPVDDENRPVADGYDPVTVHVAVTENPVARPALDRLRGLLQRPRGRRIAGRGPPSE